MTSFLNDKGACQRVKTMHWLCACDSPGGRALVVIHEEYTRGDFPRGLGQLHLKAIVEFIWVPGACRTW